jgi:hypothetical protein
MGVMMFQNPIIEDYWLQDRMFIRFGTNLHVAGGGGGDGIAAPPPLLVVSAANGELHVLKPPQGLSHLKGLTATVQHGALHVALLRISSVVTAMATALPGDGR